MDRKNCSLPAFCNSTSLNAMTQITNASLSKPAYTVLAIAAAAIGLAASAVTAQFFVLGLSQLESDPAARQALLASGLLMIVVELAAFGLAALLPRSTLHALRWQLVAGGLLLLAFEAVTIYATQVALVQSGDTAQASTQARVAGLQASISSQRAAVAALRDSGERQSASRNAWAQHLGAGAIKDALAAEARITPLVDDLATLQAGLKPTLASVLGTQGMLAYNMARALLTTGMGLLMFGAAGALLRAGRETVAAQETPAATPCATAPSRPTGYQIKTETTAGSWAPSLPLLRLAAPFVLAAAPAAQAVPVPSVAPTVAGEEPATVAETPRATPSATVADARYNAARTAVLSGTVRPSVRALQAHLGGATTAIRGYLTRLEREGITRRSGKGWELAKHADG
jgi:hypothetical protein